MKAVNSLDRTVWHLHLQKRLGFSMFLCCMSYYFLCSGFWCHRDSRDLDSNVNGHRSGFSTFLNQLLPALGQRASPQLSWATLWLFTCYFYVIFFHHWVTVYWMLSICQIFCRHHSIRASLLYPLGKYELALPISCTSPYQYLKAMFTWCHHKYIKRICCE